MLIPWFIPKLLMVLTMCQKMGQIGCTVLEILRLKIFADVSRKMAKNQQKRVFLRIYFELDLHKNPPNQ